MALWGYRLRSRFSPGLFWEIKITSEAALGEFPSGNIGGALAGFAALRDVSSDTGAGRVARG
jgi:hypothetical protein